MQSRDGVHCGRDIGQGNQHGSVAHEAGQGLTMFGSNHDVDS